MTRPGFTLLEVMIAVAILGLSLTAIFSSEVGAANVAQRARRQNIAATLARCKMGEIDEVIAIEGPGQGIDELEIQLQPDGQVRLQVRGESPPIQSGEISSVMLEVDGMPREKRPYTGEPLAFAPQGHGHFRIRLLARAPGEDSRELSEAVVELRA